MTKRGIVLSAVTVGMAIAAVRQLNKRLKRLEVNVKTLTDETKRLDGSYNTVKDRIVRCTMGIDELKQKYLKQENEMDLYRKYAR